MAARTPSTSTPQPQSATAERRPPPAGLVARVPACGCCRRCGCHLVDTLLTADVRCPTCQVWTLHPHAGTRVAVPTTPSSGAYPSRMAYNRARMAQEPGEEPA